MEHNLRPESDQLHHPLVESAIKQHFKEEVHPHQAHFDAQAQEMAQMHVDTMEPKMTEAMINKAEHLKSETQD